MFFGQRRSALLVDFENLYRSCGEQKFLDALDNWLLWLEHGGFDPEGVRRTFLVKQVFWNTHHDIHRLEFQRRRFQVTVCRAIRKEKSSSADFDITIRAAELRHEHRNLQEIVILSLDSDFSSVLYHVQLHDLVGVGMTDPTHAFSPNYRNIVDVVIEKAEFERAYTYKPTKKGWFARADGAPADALPATNAAPPVVAAAPAPAARQQPTPRRIDFAAAATLIAKHAQDSGQPYIGRERVRKLVSRLPGFTANGTPWGGGSYKAFITNLIACDSRFSIEKLDHGGIILAFGRASPEASAA